MKTFLWCISAIIETVVLEVSHVFLSSSHNGLLIIKQACDMKTGSSIFITSRNVFSWKKTDNQSLAKSYGFISPWLHSFVTGKRCTVSIILVKFMLMNGQSYFSILSPPSHESEKEAPSWLSGQNLSPTCYTEDQMNGIKCTSIVSKLTASLWGFPQNRLNTSFKILCSVRGNVWRLLFSWNSTL